MYTPPSICKNTLQKLYPRYLGSPSSPLEQRLLSQPSGVHACTKDRGARLNAPIPWGSFRRAGQREHHVHGAPPPANNKTGPDRRGL